MESYDGFGTRMDCHLSEDASADDYRCTSKAEMRIFLPEQDSPLGKTTLNVLPCVNPYTRKESFIELYNVGKQAFTWNAKTSDSWIKLSRQNGTTQLQERIIVSVDWVKVPVGERITGEIEVISGGRQEKVYLPVSILLILQWAS